MFCATVLYPNQEGGAFDFEYYSKTLAPMYAEFLGANCARYEVRKGLMTRGARELLSHASPATGCDPIRSTGFALRSAVPRDHDEVRGLHRRGADPPV